MGESIANENERPETIGNGVATESGNPKELSIDVPIKRGRGRPPGSGKNRVKDTESGSTTNKVTPVATPIDPAFLVETIVLFFELADESLKYSFVQKLKKYAPNEAENLTGLINKGGLTDTDKKILRSILTNLVNKYNILMKFGPELALLIFVGQYSLRMVNLNRAVEKLKPLEENKS